MTAELDRLDKLAAEKVMGWIWDPAHDCYLDGLSIKATGAESDENHWQPTRNIAQAWECLEKLDEIGWNVSFGYSGYKAVIMTDNWIEESAETAPLAIVRACLKAKGVEI